MNNKIINKNGELLYMFTGALSINDLISKVPDDVLENELKKRNKVDDIFYSIDELSDHDIEEEYENRFGEFEWEDITD